MTVVTIDILPFLSAVIPVAGAIIAAAIYIIKLYMKVTDLEKEDNKINNHPVLVRFKEHQERYATKALQEDLSTIWPKSPLRNFVQD
jgi:hypothetical protein